MSVYPALAARIQYLDPPSFEVFINALEQRGWLKTGYFLDAMNHPITPTPNVDVNARIIEIPLAFHPILIGLLDPDKLFADGERKAERTSTDARFLTGVMVN